MQTETASLKAMADMVCTMATEVTVKPSEEGWEAIAIDASHVGMIRFKLKKEAFGESYSPCEPFSVDMAKFQSILRDMGSTVDMTVENGRITLKSDGTTRRFGTLSDLSETKGFPADRLALSSFAILDPIDIKSKMSSLTSISGKITVTISDAGIVLSSENESEDMTVDTPMEKCKSVSGDAKASYPSPFMQNIFKVLPKGTSLQCMMDTDMPILLKFTADKFTAEFMIAPWIESED